MAFSVILSIEEQQSFFETAIYPYLGPETYSNNYFDLIALVFQYVLDASGHRERIEAMDQLFAYGLTETQAESLFYDAVNGVTRILRTVLPPHYIEQLFDIEPYTEKGLKITQVVNTTTHYPTNAAMDAYYEQLKAHEANGDWIPDRDRQWLHVYRS